MTDTTPISETHDAGAGPGIGSQLLAELLAVVDKSYFRTSLSVQAANPAHRLYRRFGFTIVDEQDGTYVMLRSMETQSAST